MLIHRLSLGCTMQTLPWPASLDREAAASVFKAYDIRGIDGAPITSGFTERLGLALVTHLSWMRVVVGRDIRTSSPGLSTALISGLRSAGCHVIDLGEVPSPVVYHATNTLDIDGGVMVTASHNPPQYNGFKVNHGTDALAGPELAEVRDVMLGTEFASGEGSLEQLQLLPDYLAAIVQSARQPARRVKVVVDAGNAVPGPAVVELMQRLDVDAIPLFCDPDPTFPNHPPDPTRAANMRHLADAVREHGAELGLGFDGDGDRLGVVDERGEHIHGDRLLALFARDVVEHQLALGRTGDGVQVLFDVKCSMSLGETITSVGGSPQMRRTGHSFFKRELRAAPDTPLAGEMSGHFFFNDRWPGFDDALYAAARLLEIVGRLPTPAHGGPTFSQLFAGIPVYPSTPEVKVPCADERKTVVMEAVRSTFLAAGYEALTVDGIRVRFPDGWFLCRPSNTEPILVMRAEARDDDALQALKMAVSSKIGAHVELGEFLDS